MDCWIESFVSYHDNLDTPTLFRKWAAITVVAAAMEQRTYLMTSSRLYPNVYCFLVAHPGVGKTRTIRAARAYAAEIPEFHFAPTSVTAASLVDSMLAAKRTIIRPPDPVLEYNSLMITADELGAFMHKYDDEMIGVLSAFYDNDPYGQRRRSADLKIQIKSPQISILAGSTPSNLLKFIPEGAWDQGFTSRIILVFSDERILGDDFADTSKPLNPDLIADLRAISALSGRYTVTEEYRNLVNLWRRAGETPAPTHPKLIHYNTRRRVHLYKLSMVSAAARSDTLVLGREDFNRAMNWLVEAETYMPDIFRAGATGADGKAMDEIWHYIASINAGQPVSEAKIVNFARERVPAHSVMRIFEIMERSGMIKEAPAKRIGERLWVAQGVGL